MYNNDLGIGGRHMEVDKHSSFHETFFILPTLLKHLRGEEARAALVQDRGLWQGRAPVYEGCP